MRRDESESDRDFRSRERNAGVESSERTAAARIRREEIARVTNLCSRSAGAFTSADFIGHIRDQAFFGPVEERLKRAGLVGEIGEAARLQWASDARRSTPNVRR